MAGCCDVTVDHAVLLVGYNTTGNTSYWIIKNSWGAAWGEEGYLYLARGSNECGISDMPVIPCVEGGVLPPPPPPPPPRPAWQCPPDATSVNATGTASCLWHNNTNGMVMPPPSVIGEYCDYVASGYMGYTFPASLTVGEYPCAPSFASSSNGGTDWFCVIESGENGFTQFPAGVTAECGSLSTGMIGYSWKSS